MIGNNTKHYLKTILVKTILERYQKERMLLERIQQHGEQVLCIRGEICVFYILMGNVVCFHNLDKSVPSCSKLCPFMIHIFNSFTTFIM